MPLSIIPPNANLEHRAAQHDELPIRPNHLCITGSNYTTRALRQNRHDESRPDDDDDAMELQP